MQNVADGQEFGPITDKLIRDMLNAGMRLTAEVQAHPDQLGVRLQAYTVELTTAIALAIGRLELAQNPPAAAEPRRRATGTHLSLLKPTD